MAYCPDICDHEVLWETGVETPERPHWLLAGPSQFAYWGNRSAADAINVGLQYVLQHLNSWDVHQDFVDFSSALNTIIPEILHRKLNQLTVSASTCQRVSRFLTDKRQQVRLGGVKSSSQTISTGLSEHCAPQSPITETVSPPSHLSADPATVTVSEE